LSDPVSDRRDLLAALLGPAGPQLSCEECFEQLDRYVDVQLTAAAADRVVPGMRAHLTGCPACQEDHESLLELVVTRGVLRAPWTRRPTARRRQG
jgi:anti-sigma factor RsiW